MALDDDKSRNLDIGDFQDLDFADKEGESSVMNTDSLSNCELCVPTDSIEDLEWFPSFYDELMSMSDAELLSLAPAFEKQSFVDFPVIPELQEESSTKSDHKSSRKDAIERNLGLSAGRRARTKNHFRRREEVPWMKKKCTHCETDRTPQWRNGPMGPKTLCNACGVRYKSGRLVPEYRPASSPTFDSSKHSNFHKKILKKHSLT